MKVLILGGTGMLGHQLTKSFQNHFDTYATVRHEGDNLVPFSLGSSRIKKGVDAFNIDSIVGAFSEVCPQVVINCIGIVKQLPSAKDPIASLQVNALFPHQLAQLCAASKSRLIHLSTDCVFSGNKGMYQESDSPDPVDLYGHTKLLGEVYMPNSLTLRTSLIGRQLSRRTGLVEWFINCQERKVKGYTNAIFSGLTTSAMGSILIEVIEEHPSLAGLYHVSSKPISKYELLARLRGYFRLDVEIETFSNICCDRSLDSTRFRSATGIHIPEWDLMLDEAFRAIKLDDKEKCTNEQIP